MKSDGSSRNTNVKRYLFKEFTAPQVQGFFTIRQRMQLVKEDKDRTATTVLYIIIVL